MFKSYSTGLGHLAQMSSVVFWSFGWVLQKTLAEPYSLKALVAMQMLLSAIVLWSVVGGRKLYIAWGKLPPSQIQGQVPLTLRFAIPRLLWGSLAPGLVIPLIYLAAQRLEGVVLSFFIGFLPLFVPLLARVILKERAPLSLYLGGGIALLGTSLEIWRRSNHQEIDGWGIVLIVTAVFFASLSQILGRFFNRSHANWERMAALQITGAAIISLMIWLFSGEAWVLPLKNTREILICGYLVLMMTSLNFLLFNLALSRIPAGWVSLYGVLAPLVGAVASVIVLKEVLTYQDSILIITVMLGLGIPHYFANVKKIKSRLFT